MNLKNDKNIMYIMVIGFHHKKGCQLEYVYPCDSLIRKKTDSKSDSESSDLYELPKKWKHVPSLALPDGSHNYDQDYIYFHLEDITDQDENRAKKTRPNDTIFGVSCYRQIDASELIKKDSEVTRNSLQKSVCILSRQPIYSSLRLKLHSITTAYFAQKDFHKTQILQNAFHNLSSSYTDHAEISKNSDLMDEKSKYLMGFSLGDLVIKYQHKILVLFKLLLLQKKCLYQIKPVSNLSNTIMALVSLIPDIFSPNGLEKCSGYFDSIDLVNSELNRKSNSEDSTPILTLPPLDKLNRKMHKKFLKKQAKSQKNLPSSNSSPVIAANDDLNESKNSIFNSLSSNTQRLFTLNSKNKIDPENIDTDTDADIYKLALDDDRIDSKNFKLDLKQSSSQNSFSETENIGDLIKNRVNNVINWSTSGNKKSTMVRSVSFNSKPEKFSEIQLTDLLEIDFGMPLNLFNEFNILHPYLSLYYLDYFMTINKMSTKLYCTTTLMMNMMKENRQSRIIEEDVNEIASNEANTIPSKKPEPKTVGYTIGATNALFKQRLYDDLDVFIDDCEIDLKNNESLKKILQLTTADLRFTDYLIKNVNSAKSIGEKLNNTPTLLSFKKTSSLSTFDPKDINDTTSQSSTWEGSDDWIRLNFKWYLYTLLGCIVKEEECCSMKNELEAILVNINNDLSSSSSSLDNEVVDIDDYIEKVNTSVTETKLKKDRKNSSSSSSTISSSQYFYIVQNSNQFSAYREDFNTNFINEFKKTDSFKQWMGSNKLKLEKSLLKFERDRLDKQLNECQNLNQKFQVLFQSLHEFEQFRLSHPFNGQMSVSDIKLRFNFLFTTTESGRKINKAIVEGSKLVNNTGKVVSDALSQAKSSFSSFLSNWTIGSNTSVSNTKSTSKNFTKI